MNEQLILDKTKEFVENQLKKDASGHDFFHIERVVKLAKYIQKNEGGNLFLIELSALLHDIGDYKLNKGVDLQEKLITEFLESLQLDKANISEVLQIVTSISYSKSYENRELSLEAKILQDADRLDAIGALGIARTFAYGGSNGSIMYDPEIKPKNITNTEEYKNAKSTTINHFYEKLLLLSAKMNTETAKILAKKRHQFMLDYLNEFYKEWNFV